MVRVLPDRPDLEQLRRQAKELRRAAAAGETEAQSRIRAVADEVSLAAAQLALAREHGFASWPRLKTEVERKNAVVRGDVDALARLVRAHPELAREPISSCYTGPGMNPLGYVAVAGFHGIVDHHRAAELARVLLAAGVPVDGEPEAGETPLITAVSYYETDLVRVLIEAGADLEAFGNEVQGTALKHAVWFGQPRIVDLLVAAGAVVPRLVEAAGAGDVTGFLHADTPMVERARALGAAAACERLAVVDQLLATGVDVNVDLGPSEHYSGTPLHRAAWHGRTGSVRHLLARGADSTRRDLEHGQTPLEWWHRRNTGLDRFPGQRTDPEAARLLGSDG